MEERTKSEKSGSEACRLLAERALTRVGVQLSGGRGVSESRVARGIWLERKPGSESDTEIDAITLPIADSDAPDTRMHVIFIRSIEQISIDARDRRDREFPHKGNRRNRGI
jgi:hypothetical protein